MISLIASLQGELENEAKTTRKMLERIPDDQFLWKPHEKSMTIQRLATHIAELPTWIPMVVDTSELDFDQSGYQPKLIGNKADLMKLFEQSLDQGREALKRVRESQLEESWTLRKGKQIFSTKSKAEVLRMSYCQIVHHRAQLGVYLRLLDIPIPGSYGPSADDPTF
ncbi:MAG: DinB family protein [Chitinophagaceae bacterium]